MAGIPTVTFTDWERALRTGMACIDRSGDLRMVRLDPTTGATVLAKVAVVGPHPKRQRGLCPFCRHYGDDCTGGES